MKSTNYKTLTKLFPNKVIYPNLYTEDCETITFICTETNRIEYYKTVAASCGCCSETMEYYEDADYIINHLSDDDFKELIKTIKK